MPALNSGVAAPNFFLLDLNGRQVSLAAELQKGPVILAFFKVSCPVCQLAFPYLQRLYEHLEGKANIFGISQNREREAKLFASEYGVRFPVLLDDPDEYGVSNAYGLTNVPTVFLVSRDSEIELSSVGWSRQDMEELNDRLARQLGIPARELFQPGENVPAFKAG